MTIGSNQPISAAAGWVQEWQRLGWGATNRVMGHYFQGCAHLAMTHTPPQAMAALHAIQAGLLRHAADTLAEATRLWRKQCTAHGRAPTEPGELSAIRSRVP